MSGTGMSRTGRVERETKETKVLVEIDLDGTGAVRHRHRRRLLRPHAQPARQARRLRPDRADQRRPGDRRAPHDGGHRARAGRGVRAGARRQGGHPPVRQRDRADGRGAGAGRRSTCPAGRTWCTTSRTLAPYIGPVYPTSMTRHILESFGHAARITLHVRCCGRPGRAPADAHHVVEAQFKAVARALREAVASTRAAARRAVHQGRPVSERDPRRSRCSGWPGCWSAARGRMHRQGASAERAVALVGVLARGGAGGRPLWLLAPGGLTDERHGGGRARLRLGQPALGRAGAGAGRRRRDRHRRPGRRRARPTGWWCPGVGAYAACMAGIDAVGAGPVDRRPGRRRPAGAGHLRRHADPVRRTATSTAW